MSFLSNFSTLLGILLEPTDLLESNEDKMFVSGTYKKGNTSSNLKKIRKIFVWKWCIKLCFWKIVFEIFEINMLVLSTVRSLGISTEMFLII